MGAVTVADLTCRSRQFWRSPVFMLLSGIQGTSADEASTPAFQFSVSSPDNASCVRELHGSREGKRKRKKKR